MKVLGVALSHDAVETVRADDEIGVVPVDVGVLHVGSDLDANAQLLAALTQVREQLAARQPAESVAPRTNHVAAAVNADVVPMEKLARQGVIRLGVRGREVVLRRVGEDHAESERVVEPVALEDRNLVSGIGFLHQDPEVQRGRSAADRDDLHLMSCPAMMRCWISVVPS